MASARKTYRVTLLSLLDLLVLLAAFCHLQGWSQRTALRDHAASLSILLQVTRFSSIPQYYLTTIWNCWVQSSIHFSETSESGKDTYILNQHLDTVIRVNKLRLNLVKIQALQIAPTYKQSKWGCTTSGGKNRLELGLFGMGFPWITVIKCSKQLHLV